jgi:ankyrin repeat protein
MINLDHKLINAARDGDLNLVKQLISKGVNIHADNEALKLASLSGHLEVVKYLVEQNADIHADNDEALRWASSRGQLGVVRYLIEQGADIHVNNDYALRYARYGGHLEVVKYLIGKGADIPELMNVPEELQEIAIQNDVKNIKYIRNLRSDLEERYRHLLQASGFGLFSDD